MPASRIDRVFSGLRPQLLDGRSPMLKVAVPSLRKKTRKSRTAASRAVVSQQAFVAIPGMHPRFACPITGLIVVATMTLRVKVTCGF